MDAYVSRCTCAEWYYGERCETANACVKSNCQHDATCVNVTADQFRCFCVDSYFGDECQFFNACHSSPCLNGGRCSVEQGDRYSCRCRPGYRGVDCRLYDPCASSPCFHGGRCTALSDATFRLICWTITWAFLAALTDRFRYHHPNSKIGIVKILRDIVDAVSDRLTVSLTDAGC